MSVASDCSSFNGKTLSLGNCHGPSISQYSSALEFLDWVARLILVGSGGRHAATVKLILSTQDGYIVRSDIFRQRLAMCKDIERVEEFVFLDQHVKGYQDGEAGNPNLSELLSLAVGAVLEREDVGTSPSVDEQLQDRLSFPWLC